MQITKLFNGNSESDLNNGVRIFIDWERLNPAIDNAVMLRPDEQVKGYVIDEKGINISIGRKPGRKVSAKESEE